MPELRRWQVRKFDCPSPPKSAFIQGMKRRGERALVLAIDIGTSSTRTALFDLHARRLVDTTAQKPYQLKLTPDGGAVLPPDVVRDATLACLRSTMRNRGGHVIAVGASCFWHGLLGADESGRALTPIYTWADSRCRTDAAKLRRKFSEHAVHARTGCMLRASFWPAKLVWLRRTRPRLFKRVKRWMSAAEWLHGQLGGERHCSYAMASGTGLLNVMKLEWDGDMLESCGLTQRHLDPLTDAAFACDKAAGLRDAWWFPAIGDGAASNLGSGATLPGLAAINYGTSAAVRLMRRGQRAHAPFGLFCYRVDAERFVVGGAVSNAGNLRAWCLRELNVRGTASTRRELTVLPAWVSARAPNWPELLRGAIVGLTQATTAADILQATTEATFYRLARIAEMLPARRFVVSGGIEQSRESLQRLADVLGKELMVCSEPEASLRGAAVFVLQKLGVEVPPPPAGRVIHPRRTMTKLHAKSRQRGELIERLLSNGSAAAIWSD
jgi:gluconokinase